jgi:hypothetical protein
MGKRKRGPIVSPADAASAARNAQFEQLLATLSAISGSLGAMALRLAPQRQKLKNQGDQSRSLAKLGLEKKAIVRLTESKGPKKSSGKARRGGRRKSSAKR